MENNNEAAQAQQGGVDIQTILRATADGYEMAKTKLMYAEHAIKNLQEENERLKLEIGVLKETK
jgi:hypothetical protein